MKLHTCIRGHYVRSLTKSHNSGLDFKQIMTLFVLRNSWLSFCMQVGISITTKENGLKLNMCTLGHDLRSLTKSHNSDFDFKQIMPLFVLRNSWLSFCVLVVKFLRVLRASLYLKNY